MRTALPQFPPEAPCFPAATFQLQLINSFSPSPAAATLAPQPSHWPHPTPVSGPTFHLISLLFFHCTIQDAISRILINITFILLLQHFLSFPVQENKTKQNKLKRTACVHCGQVIWSHFSLDASLLSLPSPPTLTPHCIL